MLAFFLALGSALIAVIIIRLLRKEKRESSLGTYHRSWVEYFFEERKNCWYIKFRYLISVWLCLVGVLSHNLVAQSILFWALVLFSILFSAAIAWEVAILGMSVWYVGQNVGLFASVHGAIPLVVAVFIGILALYQEA